MSSQRAVNRTERRHMNQELHVMRRELENTVALATPDEVAAAKAEAIESISDSRFGSLTKKLNKAESWMLETCDNALDIDALFVTTEKLK